jgi:hypothetical protein
MIDIHDTTPGAQGGIGNSVGIPVVGIPPEDGKIQTASLGEIGNHLIFVVVLGRHQITGLSAITGKAEAMIIRQQVNQGRRISILNGRQILLHRRIHPRGIKYIGPENENKKNHHPDG